MSQPPMEIRAEELGSRAFREDHGVRFAYAAGAMAHGIASEAMVTRLARARLLSFFGTGGLSLDRMEQAIVAIRRDVGADAPWGMNLLCNLAHPAFEDATVGRFLEQGVPCVEAAAFMQITPSLVHYRARGLRPGPNGRVMAPHRILAKLSRMEVAAAFLSPPPTAILRGLVGAGKLTHEEARLAETLPMADDLCVESDSGGHSDKGVALVLLPAVIRQRDAAMQRYRYPKVVRVGAAGGIGTPEAVVACFMMGADFVMTGSINQCTVEAGTSDVVKDLLEKTDVHDTGMAPAGDMFEVGAKVQVLKRGLLFPSRATKLYEIYQRCGSLEEIDAPTRRQIEESYFRRPIEEVWKETKEFFNGLMPEVVTAAERAPKQKMALVFKWYFVQASRRAIRGAVDQGLDVQIHCGPAMGAFNQWVKGTRFEAWKNRHVDAVAEHLMAEAAQLMGRRLHGFSSSCL